MNKYFLVHEFEGSSCILDECNATSKKEAQNKFEKRDWTIGEVLLESEYLKLNPGLEVLENQDFNW